MITASEARRRGLGPFRGIAILALPSLGFWLLLAFLFALWIFGGAS